MPNPLVLLQGAVAQTPPQVLFGKVSPNRSAPASFSDPLEVVIPQWRPDYYWTITNWPACHGNTLPSQGADCVLVMDDQRNLWCLFWTGAHS